MNGLPELLLQRNTSINPQRRERSKPTHLVLGDNSEDSDGELACQDEEKEGEVRSQEAAAFLHGAAAAEEAEQQHEQARADQRIGQVLRQRVVVVHPEQPEQRGSMLVD